MSFTCANDAIQNALSVTNKELLKRLTVLLKERTREFIIRLNQKINTVSKNGGLSTLAFFNDCFGEFGEEIDAKITTVAKEIVSETMKLIPVGYTAKRYGDTGINLSWKDASKWDTDSIDIDDMVDRLMFGKRGKSKVIVKERHTKILRRRYGRITRRGRVRR